MGVEELDSSVAAERRKAKRVECSLQAHIHVGSARLFRCLVKDISKTGARILLPSGSWEPNNMELVLIDTETKIQARKIWSVHGMMGIEFDKSTRKREE